MPAGWLIVSRQNTEVDDTNEVTPSTKLRPSVKIALITRQERREVRITRTQTFSDQWWAISGRRDEITKEEDKNEERGIKSHQFKRDVSATIIECNTTENLLLDV